MNGQVSRLYDLDSIAIPDEMQETHVREQNVEERVQALHMSMAKAIDVSCVEQGDVVFCTPDSISYPDGRTILLYTGTPLRGAIEAAHAAVGGKAGDVLDAELNGRKAKLTICRIVRREPAEVNDELIAGLGIADVTTVEAYRNYVAGQIRTDQQMENKKKITRYILDTMIARSTFVYDEEEINAEVQANLEETMAEYAAEGLSVTPQEIFDNAILQEKQMWLAKALCRQYDVPIDEAAIEEQVDQMIEVMQMTGEEIPERAELADAFREGEFMNGMFALIDKVIREKTEGHHGDN